MCKNFIVIFSKRAVDDVRRHGKICVLDIEIEGVKQVKRTDLDPLLVFVMPPSIEELERRLRARNTEHEDALKKRLQTACKEIKFGKNYERKKNLKTARKKLQTKKKSIISNFSSSEDLSYNTITLYCHHKHRNTKLET